MATVEQALRSARQRLSASPSARLDAELLLAHALGRRRTWLRAWPEAVLPDRERTCFESLIERREAGEPVAYLLGRREFWALELEVGPGVLIPRPETETLVWSVLQWLPAPAQRPLDVVDLGTGSGCIALTLAHARPDLHVTAIDNSEAALAFARRNAERHRLDNVAFLCGNWFDPLEGGRFDAIVSNPPYVRQGDPHLGKGDLRFEPQPALVAGADGLDAIRNIAASAPGHLASGGLLAVEHGCEQADAVAERFVAAGLEEVVNIADAAGLPRVTMGANPERDPGASSPWAERKRPGRRTGRA